MPAFQRRFDDLSSLEPLASELFGNGGGAGLGFGCFFSTGFGNSRLPLLPSPFVGGPLGGAFTLGADSLALGHVGGFGFGSTFGFGSHGNLGAGGFGFEGCLNGGGACGFEASSRGRPGAGGYGDGHLGGGEGCHPYLVQV